MNCPECAEAITDDVDECPNCEHPLRAPHEPLHREAFAVPPSTTRLLFAKVMAVAMLGWLGLQAYLGWVAYHDGFISSLVPSWNSLVVVGAAWVVFGVFRHKMWAQRWAVGIAFFTALNLALHATRAGDTRLLWAGAAVLAVAALAIGAARAWFTEKTSVSPGVQRVIAVIAIVASIAVAYANPGTSGSEHGRHRVAAEMQNDYVREGVTNVQVYVDGRDLVISAPSDTDEQIDEAAVVFRAALAKTGSDAQVWVVGFRSIVITNGQHRRVLTP